MWRNACYDTSGAKIQTHMFPLYRLCNTYSIYTFTEHRNVETDGGPAANRVVLCRAGVSSDLVKEMELQQTINGTKSEI